MPNSASVDAKKTRDRSLEPKSEMECSCVPLIDDNVGSATTQTCGNFCSNTNAKMQRTIVWNIMRNFYIASAASSSSCASPTGENYLTSRNGSTEDFQLKRLLSERVGNAGDRKFLINAKWWNQWCDFVNFGKDEGSKHIDEEDTNGESFFERPRRSTSTQP